MNSIDPFQFRDMFRSARSVAIIGNAPCILDWKNGAAIDAHDIVVRFNRARTAGLEERIGQRTDILFVNANNSLAKAPSPTETVRPRCIVCMVTPKGVHDTNIEPFREWVGACPVLLTFPPDMLELPSLPRGRRLTSGTCALFTLLQMFDVHKLFVSGFTMFGAVAGGAEKYWQEAPADCVNCHDLDQEARLFTGMLQRFDGELNVTPEVEALARQNGIQLAVRNGSPAALQRRLPLRKRLAEGLAWRLLRAGMALRRVAEKR